MTEKTATILSDLIKIGLPLLFSCILAYLGYKFNIWQFVSQKKMEYIEHQINEFYAPIIGCLMKIRAITDLRVKIEIKSDAAWREKVEYEIKPQGKHSDDYFEPFKQITSHGNKQLREEIMPLYDKMLSIFTDKYIWAQLSTQVFYPEFYNFVELWHRYLNKTIPIEVIQKINHSEEKLKPFYINLENEKNILMKKIIRTTK